MSLDNGPDHVWPIKPIRLTACDLAFIEARGMALAGCIGHSPVAAAHLAILQRIAAERFTEALFSRLTPDKTEVF